MILIMYIRYYTSVDPFPPQSWNVQIPFLGLLGDCVHRNPQPSLGREGSLQLSLTYLGAYFL